MTRSKPADDFNIYVDPSCLSTPMDEDMAPLTGDVDKSSDTPQQTETDAHRPSNERAENSISPESSIEQDARSQCGDEEADFSMPAESSDQKSANDTEPNPEPEQPELRPSIETDDDLGTARKEMGASSRSSTRTTSSKRGDPIEQGDSTFSDRPDRSFQTDDGEQPYVDHSELDAESTSHISNSARRVGDGDESSSQHEGTDEDVFTDKSPRSSMGSYDAGSDSGKGIDMDNMTTITHSSRISDISQYDKGDFIPTARGTPRPPFRTPSDVRALQMSSPAGSVLGSPRSSRKHFPTVSRLGTPSASAQYSPKRRSTPPRFKSRHEAPLVLLHVTLLPLRWVWGDLVNNLDPAEMSEQAKTLRDSWRILQDRVGDTVIERGILLGHPQNDYEVLEERLLEALDLPVRRRARILECGHYLGPSNEITLTEDEESEDDSTERRRQSATRRHWCSTCNNEIRYDSLGEVKVFRVKVYASNGLMRSGAWEACWKEMERVDVELEPIVEPSVQDEIVRLAAVQQEREIAQQEEAEIAKEVALQYEEQRRSEEHLLMQQAQAHQLHSSPPPELEAAPEMNHDTIRESRSSRRQREDEERLREIYGQTTPPPPEPHAREPSPHHHDADPYTAPSPPPSEEGAASEQRGHRRREYQSASLPELLLQSARVLMQDRKNVVIVTLSLFVLLLSLRSAPPEPQYEPVIHRMKTVPEMRQDSVGSAHPAAYEQQRLMDARIAGPMGAALNSEVPHHRPSPSTPTYQEAWPSYEALHDDASRPSLPNSDYQEATPSLGQPPVGSAASGAVSQPAQDASTSRASVSTIYEPCESPANGSPSLDAPAVSAVPDTPAAEEAVQETIDEIMQETVQEVETTTEKKIVKVVHTVTQTQTHTQTQVETQTEVETATAVETVVVKATETPLVETTPKDEEEEPEPEPRGDAVIAEQGLPGNEVGETEPTLESTPEAVAEPFSEPMAAPEEVPVEV